MNSNKLVIAPIAGAFLFCMGAPVESQTVDNKVLMGVYDFAAEETGSVTISKPTSGSCAVSDYGGAIMLGQLIFDGQGNLSAFQYGTYSKVDLSLGATTCFQAHTVRGSYTAYYPSSDRNFFEATGSLNIEAYGSPSPKCQQTSVSRVPFKAYGTKNSKSVQIIMYGAGDDSKYAEGTQEGPVSCQAKVLNFMLSGQAKFLR